MTLNAGQMTELYLQPQATQIGNQEPSSYNSQVFAYYTYEGQEEETDLIEDSGYSSSQVTITIVNNAELSPVSGATFVINPKLHSPSNNGTIFNDKDAT
jgi:hypothetical protein